MVNISVLKISSKTCSSSLSTRQHTFKSQFLLSLTILILLVGFCPSVTSSPTSSSSTDEQNKKINGYSFDSNVDQASTNNHPSSSSSSSTVHKILSSSSPDWYIQPRLHANQFLVSAFNENENFLPKGHDKFYHDDQINFVDDNDDDDIDSNLLSTTLFHRRTAANGNHLSISNLKKRKQLNKPPMEVMNEIVNSIYLKR